MAMLQLIFIATGSGEGFGALGLGRSLRRALVMEDRERQRFLELDRRWLGGGEERVLL